MPGSRVGRRLAEHVEAQVRHRSAEQRHPRPPAPQHGAAVSASGQDVAAFQPQALVRHRMRLEDMASAVRRSPLVDCFVGHPADQVRAWTTAYAGTLAGQVSNQPLHERAAFGAARARLLEQRRGRLDAAVAAVFKTARGPHGSRRLHAYRREAGWQVSVKTVADSMRRQAWLPAGSSAATA